MATVKNLNGVYILDEGKLYGPFKDATEAMYKANAFLLRLGEIARGPIAPGSIDMLAIHHMGEPISEEE